MEWAIFLVALVIGLQATGLALQRRQLEKRRRPVVVQVPRLSERELRAAFNIADTTPLWRAVLQVIDEVQAEARDGAEKSVANHGICASCVGGGEFLTRLRERMVLERDAAIKQPAE